MSVMIPPSRLLPVTILVTAVALGIKAYALVTFAPTPGALWAATIQAVETARTAILIGQAQAAQATTTEPLPPAVAPAPPSSAAAPLLPVSASPAPRVEMPKAPANAAGDATQEIKLRRSPIEEREQRLSEREATLAAVDIRLSGRVAELQAIQTRLETLEADRKAHEEANWTGLVKLYEGMRPRDAAAIFNALDKPVLLEILDRMKPGKAAPVIAMMEPESARQATADLAARRTRSTTVAN
jgi:flagellar motility protein MotE (MotC chaperone)